MATLVQCLAMSLLKLVIILATVAVAHRNFPQEHFQPSQVMAQLVHPGKIASGWALILLVRIPAMVAEVF